MEPAVKLSMAKPFDHQLESAVNARSNRPQVDARLARLEGPGRIVNELLGSYLLAGESRYGESRAK